MITTKQPTDDMIEVAIVAMEETLRADGEQIPPGGLDLERDAMPEPGETAAAVRAMAEADEATGTATGTTTSPTTTTTATGTKAAEGEAVAPVSIDPPLAG
jgi:hypothetical protein